MVSSLFISCDFYLLTATSNCEMKKPTNTTRNIALRRFNSILPPFAFAFSIQPLPRLPISHHNYVGESYTYIIKCVWQRIASVKRTSTTKEIMLCQLCPRCLIFHMFVYVQLLFIFVHLFASMRGVRVYTSLMCTHTHGHSHIRARTYTNFTLLRARRMVHRVSFRTSTCGASVTKYISLT